MFAPGYEPVGGETVNFVGTICTQPDAVRHFNNASTTFQHSFDSAVSITRASSQCWRTSAGSSCLPSCSLSNCSASTNRPRRNIDFSSGPSTLGPEAVVSGFFENVSENTFKKSKKARANLNGKSKASSSIFAAGQLPLC